MAPVDPELTGDEQYAWAQENVGLFQITEALLGHHFPATRQDLTHQVGHEEVILVEGRTASMEDVLRQLPDITYDTPQSVIGWVERRWPNVLRVGRDARP